jgi:uncharacterized protein YdhG (YjbR/CyaY superfamily)
MKRTNPARRATAAKSRTGHNNQKKKKKTASKQALSRPTALKRRAAKAKASSKSKSAAPQTVDQYFAAVPEPARAALQQIRAAIRSVVPSDSTEVISYKIPAFKHKKAIVWYAAFSNHCSLFPTAAVIEQFKDELSGFSTSKGTIHLPLDKSMPVELIKKIVRAGVLQSEEKMLG